MNQKTCLGGEDVRASVMRMVYKYAEQSPFFLNPDEIVVKTIVNGLVRNKSRHGYAYCPCRNVKGSAEKDKDNMCPCQTHKEDIARQGTRECGLFVSEAYFNAKRR